jgi:hypothetical protein
MPLGQAHRYNADNRDGGFSARRGELAERPKDVTRRPEISEAPKPTV